jgi:integrase
MCPNGMGLVRRHMDRQPPCPLVKQYCEVDGIDPSRFGGHGIGIHSLRKTAINDAIRNGATMREVRKFVGHAVIRTTELCSCAREEDAEVAARRIQIRLLRFDRATLFEANITWFRPYAARQLAAVYGFLMLWQAHALP